MMMKKRTIVLAYMLLAVICAGCYKEENLTNEWVYTEPVPAITDGPSEAQSMCYDLYRKYDLHVYYTLSGDTALRTGMGYAPANVVQSNNRAAIPMQAADEKTAGKFLTLLTDFWELFPEDMVFHGLHKRQVLVKINPAANRYMDDSGTFYWLNTYTVDVQGVIYYGYLDNVTDTDDKFISRLQDWKWNICFQFIKGLVNYTKIKDAHLPEAFGQVSKGLYKSENKTEVDVCIKLNRTYLRYEFNRPIGKKCGFVHPLGAMAMNGYPGEDWASLVAWIMTVPLADRKTDLDMYDRLKQKYDIVLQYYKDKSMDLEAMAARWQAVKVE